MNATQKLLDLHLKIEGMLRILDSRDSHEARELLRSLYGEYSRTMADFLDEVPLQLASYPAPTKTVSADLPKIESTTPTAFFELDDDEDNNSDFDLPAAFTANDHRRFCDELFEGNEDDYSSTLSLISDMSCYSEAEDYLLNDMMWDSGSAVVAEFLDILEQNMPQ